MNRRLRWGWGCVVLVPIAVMGCSGAADGADQPDTPAGAAGAGASCQTTSDTAQGTGTLSGAVNGKAFGVVANALWIGQPDSAATTVVYLFSKPVVCSDLCSPGWDTRIADGTQVLELKALGVAPATFPVVKTLTPATGEAVVNTTISSTSATPSETSGSGGTLTLTDLQDKQTAAGTFDLLFASDGLHGSFSAAYCPEGHEP
jgi:hypothetical protein